MDAGPDPAQPKTKMADPALKLDSLTRSEKKILTGSIAAWSCCGRR